MNDSASFTCECVEDEENARLSHENCCIRGVVERMDSTLDYSRIKKISKKKSLYFYFFLFFFAITMLRIPTLETARKA